jgi:hypothetical protein
VCVKYKNQVSNLNPKIEELLELINLIVRYLVTHTHAYPGLPPVPVTQDGTTVDNILTELQQAVKKILNQNIRLN